MVRCLSVGKYCVSGLRVPCTALSSKLNCVLTAWKHSDSWDCTKLLNRKDIKTSNLKYPEGNIKRGFTCVML